MKRLVALVVATACRDQAPAPATRDARPAASQRPSPIDAAPPAPPVDAAPAAPSLRLLDLTVEEGSPIAADGLPAITTDGAELAALIPIGSGELGIDGVALERFDVATGKARARTVLIDPFALSDAVEADDPAALGAYQAGLERALSRATAELARQRWRPLEVGAPDHHMQPQEMALGDLRLVFDEDRLQVSRAGAELLAWDAARAITRPRRRKGDDCSDHDLSLEQVIRDPTSTLLLVTIRLLPAHDCGEPVPDQSFVLRTR